jgi:hypothetical protein
MTTAEVGRFWEFFTANIGSPNTRRAYKLGGVPVL